jgi:hypothetical protein
MRRPGLTVSAVAVALLAGCASAERYEAILDSWIGVHVDRLVVRWGPPQDSFTLSDGGSVIEYTSRRTEQIGGHTITTPVTNYHTGAVRDADGVSRPYSGTSTSYVTTTTPVSTLHFWCRTRFIVAADGTITSWRASGNDCQA